MAHEVSQLGYLEIETACESDWLALAETIGFEIVEAAGYQFGLRMDADRRARLLFQRGEVERISAIGWEASGGPAYREILRSLRASGVEAIERQDLAKSRGVQEVAQFRDPEGLPAEIYWGAHTGMRTQFRSPEHVTFVAGEMGVGHVTLAVRDARAFQSFYTDMLGLKLTEIAEVGPLTVAFLRAGARHHSLAITEVPSGVSKVDHIMVEVGSLDDLGAIRDRLQQKRQPIRRDFGRHPTDGVISFYVATPGGFNLELGWGSFVVDENTWEQERYRRAQWSWGHRAPGETAMALGEDV